MPISGEDSFRPFGAGTADERSQEEQGEHGSALIHASLQDVKRLASDLRAQGFEKAGFNDFLHRHAEELLALNIYFASV